MTLLSQVGFDRHIERGGAVHRVDVGLCQCHWRKERTPGSAVCGNCLGAIPTEAEKKWLYARFGEAVNCERK